MVRVKISKVDKMIASASITGSKRNILYEYNLIKNSLLLGYIVNIESNSNLYKRWYELD
jgi:hypothetical protein